MLVQAKLHVGVLLVELENELRALGWWESQAPAAQALQSQQPFCVDTLEFSQWLQWVFIPRMQSIVLTQQPLPKQCEFLRWLLWSIVKKAWRPQHYSVA